MQFVYFHCHCDAIKRITAQIAIEIVDARNIIAGYCCRIIWWCLYFDNVTATI